MKFLNFLSKFLELAELWSMQVARFVAAATLFTLAVTFVTGGEVNALMGAWAAMTLSLSNRLIPYLRRDLRRARSRS